MTTPLRRFRTVALVEGWSYLLLLGLAMPLKYLAGLPAFVKAFGWAHGVLFVLFCLSLVEVMGRERWSLPKAAVAFVASLVPFGTFVLDRRLAREEQDRTTSPAARGV